MTTPLLNTVFENLPETVQKTLSEHKIHDDEYADEIELRLDVCTNFSVVFCVDVLGESASDFENNVYSLLDEYRTFLDTTLNEHPPLDDESEEYAALEELISEIDDHGCMIVDCSDAVDYIVRAYVGHDYEDIPSLDFEYLEDSNKHAEGVCEAAHACNIVASDISETYRGEFSNEATFFTHIAEQYGINDTLGSLSNYFDYESWGNAELDSWCEDSNHYFVTN